MIPVILFRVIFNMPVSLGKFTQKQFLTVFAPITFEFNLKNELKNAQQWKHMLDSASDSQLNDFSGGKTLLIY